MSFDRLEIEAAVGLHGPVVRVLVIDAKGSVPRGPGASMLVWEDGQQGTIGGGALEFEAVRAARAGETGVRRMPLGPALGQCCGGSVTLHFHHWSAAALAEVPTNADVFAYGPDVGTDLLDEAVQRAGAKPGWRRPLLLAGSVIERIGRLQDAVFLWGAGHVGRAVADVLAPLPGLRVTWIDESAERFPRDIPLGAERIVAADMPLLAARALADARHYIFTYSHEIDLALCHALLTGGARDIGLIGSETKWARFRTRLGQLGHSEAAISRIRCPIGNPSYGRHPQAIAVGVASEILATTPQDAS